MVPISLVDPTVVAVNLMSDVVLDGEGNKFMAVVDGTSWVGFAVVANVVTAKKTKLSFFIQKKVQFFKKTEQVAHKYYLRLQKFVLPLQ